MRGGKVVMKPTVTRTGMPGYRTPAGTYTVNFRNIKEWSDPYEVWLPYWQHFTQGMGFHETTTYLHDKSDRLARLRQPAARRRRPDVGAGQGRHPGGADRPPPRHLSGHVDRGFIPCPTGPASDTLGVQGRTGRGGWA